jgi:two-component sensor histidine kinase
LLVEVGIGLGFSLLLVILRLALMPWIGELAPFALVFVAIVGAAVLAGWRAGLIALVVGQLLIWVFVMEPRETIGFKDSLQVGALAIATLSQLLTLTILALYQREVERAWSRRENQMGLLEKALQEIDHRTSNNYQTVIALILAQAKSATDPAVKAALEQASARIGAISEASRKLATSSDNLQEVRIGEHLRDLCAKIARGLGRDGVRIDCEFADITLGADEAVCVSIIVNELVTNALKHAFPAGREGVIRVSLERGHKAVQLVIDDDGVGIDGSGATQGTGLGSRLIATYAKQMKAKHDITSGGEGTRHVFRIPD